MQDRPVANPDWDKMDHLSRPSPIFCFEHSFARELEGFYVPWQGEQVPKPRIALFNERLAADLGLELDGSEPELAGYLAGSVAPQGSEPIAQVYAGHQFGSFSPQLGDGRALLLGELLDKNGTRLDLHLKGSGRTPFSRGGDGKAVLGPVLREYVMGEAMHALGIPTSRALAATTTGEMIRRQGLKPGAVLARIASSHIRVGSFQFFAARGAWAKVRQLADYTIDRHYPEFAGMDDRYLLFLKAVSERQANLISQWMGVGFVHGVMNTDNMALSGETIDYGPCAFMEAYDRAAVFSSIDQQGRYAYGNQPSMAQWNLARFAENPRTPDRPGKRDPCRGAGHRSPHRFHGQFQDGMVQPHGQKDRVILHQARRHCADQSAHGHVARRRGGFHAFLPPPERG